MVKTSREGPGGTHSGSGAENDPSPLWSHSLNLEPQSKHRENIEQTQTMTYSTKYLTTMPQNCQSLRPQGKPAQWNLRRRGD